MHWTVEELTALTLRYAVPAEGLRTKQERRERKVLEAATARFVAQGYRKTSVDEVARDAGVGKGTVFLYFGSKAELLVHCLLLEKAAPGLEMLRRLQAVSSPVEILRTIIHSSMRLMYELPLTARVAGGDHELRVVLEDLGPEAREFLNASRAARLEALLAPLSRVDGATLSAVARSLGAVLQSIPDVVDQARLLGIEREQHARVTTDVLVAGVLAVLDTDPEQVEPLDIGRVFGLPPRDPEPTS